MTERKIEEALERIWTAEEDAGGVKREVLNEQFGMDAANKALEIMSRAGLVKFDDNGVSFTPAGRRRAELIIRRHRLAERLLHDVLDFRSERYESSACQFEHYVGDDVVSSICTLLGHPENCPHGKAIPRGDCCLKAQRDIKSIVVPLSGLRAGAEGRVIYITTRFHNRLDRISGMGILPGTELRVHQRLPAIVVQVGESQIALDSEIAKDIYVRCKHQ